MRFIFLAVATSLICHDITLGEEPNEDRIGAILSAITKINANVEVLAVKVDGMEKNVKGIENKVDDVIKKEGEHFGDVTKEIGEVTKQINVVDAKVEKVDNDVIYNTWKFVGRGTEGSYDAEVYHKAGTTMKECLEFCQTKRIIDGGEWNGVVWVVSSGEYWCEKNDRGHSERSDFLHFRAQ